MTGACVGAVVGLVIATPSCGYTAMGGAFLCGVIGGVLCNIACGYVRTTPDLDDQLDVFPAHGMLLRKLNTCLCLARIY